MSFFVKNHILYDMLTNQPVHQVASHNHGGHMQPWLLVYHYTATCHARSALNMLTRPDSPRVSAHILIDRDGTVHQLVPFNRVAWHAGKSSWEGHIGCNNFSIGIEQVNAGIVLKRGDHTFMSQIEHEIIEAKDVIHAEHRITHGMAYWQIYTEEQVNMAIAVGKAIAEAYHIKEVVGHEDIAPHRKVDPGPAYPLDHVRTMVLGHGDDDGSELKLSHTEISHAPETLVEKSYKGLTPSQYFSNAALIYHGFLTKGMSHNFACGMLANAQAESSLDPTEVGDDGAAVGLWQLHNDRRTAIRNGCGIEITHLSSVNDNIDAVWWELNNTEQKAFAMIKQAALTSAGAAGAACCIYYERAGAFGASVKRTSYAQTWDSYFMEHVHG